MISDFQCDTECFSCCSVLQCVAVCCSVSQRFAVWFSVLQAAALCCSVLQRDTEQNRATRPELLKEFLCRSGSPSSNCADLSVVPAYMCVCLICMCLICMSLICMCFICMCLIWTAIHRITCNVLQHTTTHCIIQLCRFERRACMHVCVLNLYVYMCTCIHVSADSSGVPAHVCVLNLYCNTPHHRQHTATH